MEIISRNTKKVNNKHYISHRDKYYKDGNNYFEANTDFNDSQSNAGNIHLINKNIFSYGIRKDKDTNKLFGLRPDDIQDGSKQIEFSVNNIKYNGKDYDLSLTDSVANKNEVDLGDIKIINYPGVFRQLYKAIDVKDFVITLDIDLTGYSIKNSQYTEEKTIKDTITCEVFNVGENTGNTHISNFSSNVSNNIPSTNDKKLSFLIGKITDKNIMLGGYSREDQFTDVNLNGYTTTNGPHNSNESSANGGSTYLENAISIYCKGQNIDEEYFEDILLNNICDKYNLTLLRTDPESTDDIGEYFLYNGKKVGSWYILEDNQFVAYFNTQPIPDDVKSLFKTKDFQDTSYLNLDLSSTITDFENQFNYNMTKVEANITHYIADNNVFTIEDSDGRWINLNCPYVVDSDYNFTDIQCGHSLEYISENKYRYKKFIYPECGMLLNMKGTYYIDPTVSVDSKRFDVIKTNTTSWANARNSSSYSGSHSQANLAKASRITTSGQAGTTTTYTVLRSSYRWDTSSVSGQASGTLSDDFRGDGSKLYAVLDERAKSGVYVFSDFSCYASDGSWDETNYTSGSSPGTSELYINNQSGVSWSANGGYAHTFALTSDAITQINDNNEIDMLFMSEKDLENTAPTDGSTHYVGRGMHSSDWYGGDFNLVLSADEDDDDDAVVYNATFFGANF